MNKMAIALFLLLIPCIGGAMEKEKNVRYDGKPFLRLLELYVLDSIGELSPENSQNMEAMTPKLKSLYQYEGTWQEIIQNEMKFPANMPQLIKDNWLKNKGAAAVQGVKLNPEDYAISFVDTNLVN